MSTTIPHYPIADDEEGRLRALSAYNVYGTGPEQDYEHIVSLAADLFEVPIALLNFVGRQHQCGKAWVGLDLGEVPRGVAFCAHTILGDDVFTVPDALADVRFAANMLVTGEAHVRFYAGAPLVTPKGHKIGALCVLDTKPRPALSKREAGTLQSLAQLVMDRLELRRLQSASGVAMHIAATTAYAIICADSGQRITFWNNAAEAVFGHTRAEAMGRRLDLIIPKRLQSGHVAGFQRLAESGKPKPSKMTEVPALHKSGEEMMIELSLTPWHDDTGFGVGAIIRDITQRKRTEDELRRTRTFLDAVVEHVPAPLFVKNAREQRFVLVNRAAEDLLGISRDEMMGKTDHDFFPAAEADLLAATDQDVLRLGTVQASEALISTRAKGARLINTKKLVIPDEAGAPLYLLNFSEDITQRRAAEAQIVHMMHHDALTDLPNRALMYERLGQALKLARRHAGGVTVMRLGLDQSKTVTDTLGQPICDGLMSAVADRLRNCVRQTDTVARLGDDDFAVVRSSPGTPEEISAFAQRLAEALSEPFSIQGHQIVVGSNIGIAVAPNDGMKPDRLLRSADIALYRAKMDGRGTCRFFETGMDVRLQARRTVEVDLRQALAKKQLELHYQPLLDTRTGSISGVEALLRWRHHERGLIAPGEFIALAEEIGLIVPIGAWVLREACTEVARWPGTMKVAVNLSPKQFGRGDILQMVSDALAVSGLAPNRLELEITESVLLQDNKATLVVLQQLRSLGVRIVMDDFGTGYSSLSYLRQFPFDKIKIDQSFVREMAQDADCHAIIRAVVGLGATLGMKTTAEGVETNEQLALLRATGCDEIQGYLFSRPKSAAAVVQDHLLGPLAAFKVA